MQKSGVILKWFEIAFSLCIPHCSSNAMDTNHINAIVKPVDISDVRLVLLPLLRRTLQTMMCVGILILRTIASFLLKKMVTLRRMNEIFMVLERGIYLDSDAVIDSNVSGEKLFQAHFGSIGSKVVDGIHCTI